MKHSNPFHILPALVRLCPVLALLFVIAACEGTANHGFDYRDNHRLKVGSEQVSILITVPEAGTQLQPIESRRWERFIRDYVNRGRGVVLVERKPRIGLADDQHVEQVRRFLRTQGLGNKQVQLTPSGSQGLDASEVRLTFTANKVILPDCGNFDKRATLNPRNLVSENYGCATQRNIGAMVADPGDLVKARPFSGIDPERSLTDTDATATDATTTDTTTTTTAE